MLQLFLLMIMNYRITGNEIHSLYFYYSILFITLFHYSSEILRLKESATYEEIVEALCHPTYGVDFLSKYPSLPSNSFISYDAVQWCKKHIEGILFDEDACKLLEVFN